MFSSTVFVSSLQTLIKIFKDVSKKEDIIITTSFYKGGMKTPRLELMKVSCTSGVHRLIFHCLQHYTSFWKHETQPGVTWIATCQSLLISATYPLPGVVFATVKNYNLLLQLTLLVAAFFWDNTTLE